jgi:hypothetical protein
MLSGSGIGSLGIGVGVDPFLGGSFGGMPDFGPGGIGGALGVPLGVNFNVNLGNASNLDLLNRVAAAVNERYPSQSSAPAPSPVVASTSRPAPSVPGATGLAAQELTGDPDMDRMILAARDAQGVSTDIGPGGQTMAEYQQSVADLAEFRNLPENVAYRNTVRPEIKAAIAGLAAPFIPGAAAGIAGALGGGALASAATGAALGSGLAAATGQDPVRGALTGALGGFGQGALQAAGTTSGIASLADTASTGASVADTASRTGGVLDVLGTAADIARSPIVNAAREYMEARDERPGYTPQLPGQIDVVSIPTEAPRAPEAPGVDIGAPVISQDEIDRIEQEEEAERQRQERAAAERERQRQEAEAKAKAEAEAQAEAQRKRDAEAKAKAEREAAEAKARAEAEAKAKAEAEAEAQRKRDAEAKAKAEREAAEAKAEAERKAAEEEAAKQQAIEDELIEDGWVRNGPWRYDGNGVFTHTVTGEVRVDDTVPEGAKVGDTFDAGINNDSVLEAPEEPEPAAEDEPEEEVVIVPTGDADAGTGGADDDTEAQIPQLPPATGGAPTPGGTAPAPGGPTPGGSSPGSAGSGGQPSQQPSGAGGIQSLLPMFGLALLGRYLLGEAEKGQRRGRLPLEQESTTGYYNIDREIRRRMGLGG